MTQISVHYERKFSDGNYGSEGLSLSYVAECEPGEDLAIDESLIQARCEALSKILREAVLTELAHSEVKTVAWAANRELNPYELEEIPF